MPRLIIDDAAIELAAVKLSGAPIYAGPDGKMLAPGVTKLLEPEGAAPDRWQPGNEAARLLVLGFEACEDLVFHGNQLNSSNRLRVSKNLTVPICSLTDVVIALQRTLDDAFCREIRAGWPRTDQETYKAIGRRIRKMRNGPVRTMRNKLGAHLDKDAIGDSALRLKIDDLLWAMGDGLIVLSLALNHGSCAFVWIRSLGSLPNGNAVLETMFSYPLCVTWIAAPDGRVIDVLRVRIGEDPLHIFQAGFLNAVNIYNRLVELLGASTPPLWMRPSEEVHAAERQMTVTTDGA